MYLKQAYGGDLSANALNYPCQSHHSYLRVWTNKKPHWSNNIQTPDTWICGSKESCNKASARKAKI